MIRTIEEMTEERVAAWTLAPYREVLNDYESGATEAHLAWLRDPIHEAEEWIPLYEAVLAVIHKRIARGH
jgi:hypothetical protein